MTTPVQPETPNIVSRFFTWARERNQMENQKDKERLAAVGRGVANAAIETTQTVAEAGAFVSRKTGLGEAIEPGFNTAYDASGGARGITEGLFDAEREAVDTFMGKRSDDKIAGFVESASQFMASYLLLGQVRTVAQGAKVARAGYLLSAVGRGAVADATAMDPYEAQLAELASSLEVPGLSDLGELLSVDGDDSAIVARIKRSAAGAVLGTTIDGLVAGARALAARRVLARKNLSPEAKAAAEAKLAEAESVMEAVENGTSRPNAPIVVRANPDDTASLIMRNADGEEVVGPTFTSKAEADAQANSMNLALEGQRPKADAPDTETLGGTIRARLKGAVDAAGEVSDENMEQIAADVLGELPTERITEVLTALSKDATIQSAVNTMARAHSRNLGKSIAALDILIESRPHDPAVQAEAVRRVQELLNFEGARKWIEGEQGRALRRIGVEKMKDPRFRANADEDGLWNPDDLEIRVPGRKTANLMGPGPNSGAVPGSTPADVAGMGTRDASQAAVDAANIRQITRMFRMAGGSPKDVTAAIQATNVIRHTGTTEKVLEVFVNSLLGNPATAKTVFLSGRLVESFEGLGRVGAGVMTGNKPLAREGVDLLYGLYAHLSDNLRVARRALNEGQSVINPAPVHHAIGGTTGQVVRAPGVVLMAGDEFTRVTNYRAYIRAKSLRQGREMGLKGDRLAAHVEADLQAAFDPETGIATVPEALQYAERSTLSGPLGHETIGGKLGTFIRETPGLQFLAPFTKAMTNIFRFTTMHTPLLSRANAEARAIMEAGGEEAAVLQTKQAMATMVYTVGALLAASDNLTGSSPSDPNMRSLWLADKQEYSIRVGDQWVSYRRTDPFGLMLGLVADVVQFSRNMEQEDPDIEQMALATVSAMTQSVLTPTYMKGVGDFLDAFADGSPSAIQRWSRRMVSSFVPNTLPAFNDDPYYREVRGYLDAIKSKVPGLSETLDPKYDIFGEPVLNGGIGNRSALFRTKDATEKVESELIKLNRGFSPFSPITSGGINMADRETFDNGTGVSPYRRLMDIIGESQNGRTLRQEVEELVNSDIWEQLSPGTALYPGGERWERVQRIRKRRYDRALRQVRSEYPLLNEELRREERLERAATRGGEEAVLKVEELLGPRLQKKRVRTSRIQQ